MGQNPQKDKPNGLRPKFWEIASASPYATLVTPFAHMRISRDMRLAEVAKRMGWETSDYSELEYGDMDASPETVLAFCRAMKCHPLDLYSPEAGPETPLPREIFYSLVAMVVVPGFSDQDRVRSLLRLDLEHRRAKSMVLENRDCLRPLLASLGYSPDLKTVLAPLYDATEDDEEIGARGIMDRSLLQNQMMLESDRDTYQLLLDREKEAMDTNEKTMICKAAALFGAAKAQGAVERLSALLEKSDDKRSLCRTFMRNPDIVAPILRQDSNINPAQILEDKRAFYDAVECHVEQSRHMNRIEDNLRKADAQLRKFVNWWDNEKTLRLLDWYEDCEILKDFETTPVQIAKSDLKPGTSPMPG